MVIQDSQLDGGEGGGGLPRGKHEEVDLCSLKPEPPNPEP